MTAASDRKNEMASYSVSEVVCTFFLYMKYVHRFLFFCDIILLSPDDVLRKGSGTICEILRICPALEKRSVARNKHKCSAIGKLTRDGPFLNPKHILEVMWNRCERESTGAIFL